MEETPLPRPSAPGGDAFLRPARAGDPEVWGRLRGTARTRRIRGSPARSSSGGWPRSSGSARTRRRCTSSRRRRPRPPTGTCGAGTAGRPSGTPRSGRNSSPPARCWRPSGPGPAGACSCRGSGPSGRPRTSRWRARSRRAIWCARGSATGSSPRSSECCRRRRRTRCSRRPGSGCQAGPARPAPTAGGRRQGWAVSRADNAVGDGSPREPGTGSGTQAESPGRTTPAS